MSGGLPSALPALAFDLGGTKLAAALVTRGRILERDGRATRREAGPAGWVDDMASVALRWRGRFGAVGVAATGVVQDGHWSALNRATLDIGELYPLEERLGEAIGMPVRAVNDAQAAAWGEHRFGAGRGADMVYVTVSTGVGGGVVLGGRLLCGRGGLAGHVGQIPSLDDDRPFEDSAGGRWMSAAARRAGHALDARGVFDAAAAEERWAKELLGLSASRTARLCRTLQLLLDPERIVLGGGIGLAEGYLERVRVASGGVPGRLRPTLVPAALGADSGLLGVADLVETAAPPTRPESAR